MATAILDRLVHHSHVVTIRGDSYRLRTKFLNVSGSLSATGSHLHLSETLADGRVLGGHAAFGRSRTAASRR